MEWTVIIKRKLQRQIAHFPQTVQANLQLLIHEIQEVGPVRGNWANYSKLADNRHHCHIKMGRPTYVAVWEVVDNEVRLIEVTYVGTHEKAPY